MRYLLPYLRYNTERDTLLSTLKNIDDNLIDLAKPILTKTLAVGSNCFDINNNINVLNATMKLVYLLKDKITNFLVNLLIAVE